MSFFKETPSEVLAGTTPAFYEAIVTQTPFGHEGAVLSPGSEPKYRYRLWRRWDNSGVWVKWIMLNPSKADAFTDDPTIRKCVKFAKAWGFGGIQVVNLFAWRATDPKELKRLFANQATGNPLNNRTIYETLSLPGPNIAAWGQGGLLFSRAAAVRAELAERLIPLQALKLAKNGEPYHPLYLKDDSKPFELR